MSIQSAQPQDLWAEALAKLRKEDQLRLKSVQSDQRTVLEDVLVLVKDKQKESLRKRWSFKRKNGDRIVLRDQFEKIADWVTKFIEAGDVVVQFDPHHAALPWAGVKFLLQVSR